MKGYHSLPGFLPKKILEKFEKEGPLLNSVGAIFLVLRMSFEDPVQKKQMLK